MWNTTKKKPLQKTYFFGANVLHYKGQKEKAWPTYFMPQHALQPMLTGSGDIDGQCGTPIYDCHWGSGQQVLSEMNYDLSSKRGKTHTCIHKTTRKDRGREGFPGNSGPTPGCLFLVYSTSISQQPRRWDAQPVALDPSKCEPLGTQEPLLECKKSRQLCWADRQGWRWACAELSHTVPQLTGRSQSPAQCWASAQFEAERSELFTSKGCRWDKALHWQFS